MRGFKHETILSPSFHGVHQERLAFCVPKNDQKFRGGEGGGGTSRKIGRGCATRFLKPLPYFRQNLWFSLPYFRRDQKFDTLFQTWSPGAERVTSCYGTYALIGINIKREMVLSQNDEEVANSSKKHTKFKSRRHKPYPISDENGRIDTLFQNKTAQKKHTLWHGTYLYRLYRGISPPPRAKNAW